jgi:hypothetical protein
MFNMDVPCMFHIRKVSPSVLGRLLCPSQYGQGPVMHHHTKKETLLQDKVTIKALEVATSPKEQARSLIHDVLKLLARGRLLSKIGIQWKCKNKGQCKNMLQITLEICIPHKEHLGTPDMLSNFRRTVWHNLNRTLKKHLKENSTHKGNPTKAPKRMKWYWQTYQRLPGEEQAYSLRWQAHQSQQMDMLEWLTEGRNIGINPEKTTRMAIWSSEPGGVERTKDTSEVMKCQKLLIQGSRHDAKSHTKITGKEKSHKQTQDHVSTAEGLIKIITEESVLACLDLERLLGPGKDTLAYNIGMTLF